MRMFLLWLAYKINRLYEDHFSNLLINLWPYYKAWIFLSIIFKLVDMFGFISEGPYAKSSAMLRYTIMPIVYLSVIIPIGFYIGWKLIDWVRSQYIDYSYFSESGGKLKNEEKFKNEEKYQTIKDDEKSLNDLAIETYRKGFLVGVKKAANSKTKPVTKWETEDDKVHPLTPLEESLNNYGGDVIRENFIKSSGYTSLLLDNNASSKDAYYANCLILVTNQDGSSQIRFIVAYNGSSHEAYLDEPWEFPPDDGSKYTIILNEQDSIKNTILYPVEQQIVRTGQVMTAKLKSVKLDNGASKTDSFYNGCLITINSGTGVGQSRFIIGYNGSNKIATIDKLWDEIPDDSSIYSLVISQAYWKNEPAELKNIKSSTIIVDGAGTYIREDTGIKEVTKFNEIEENANVKIINDAEVEIKPDLGLKDKLKNNLTGDDGEIVDDPENPNITLEELLKNQRD